MYKYKRFKLNGKCYDEHRIVMEIYLCRPLLPNEVVHHKNGNGRDNCLCNLELMSRAEHARLHFTLARPTDPGLVAKIWERYNVGGTSHRKLAREFGVPKSTVGDILRRNTMLSMV